MADLSIQEKAKIEKFLGMGSGYVADFSDRTFQEFVGAVTGLDIDDPKYHYSSNSKANRLRQFIKVENDNTVGKLLQEMSHYYFEKLKEQQSTSWYQKDEKEFKNSEELYQESLKITQRLQGNIVDDIGAIKPNSDDVDFKKLSESIRESIEKNLPEIALDRLHTFVMKYIRELCKKHGIKYTADEALHSIFGKYIKFLIEMGFLETEMSKRILKTSISNLDSFNDIRNNKSFAHDNPILNYEESVLVFNSISSMIKFIEALENRINKSKDENKTDWNDISF
ncbi:Abi_C domain containing protein [Flavobacterium anhuiense]|uniref:Abi_C domain containing protein n=1 Tax=Flavobacterium anhuiense TaxID=459526 RepID=A0A444VZ59_9FLAO|nr:abortive infection family protein [Flavobacterium anhuiense]RYJ38920.1 Abi_C domain containing protein [Flavobacterium anhuiense]